MTWGCGFVDFENKGARDIFIVCGHLQDNIEAYDDTTSYHARCILLRNTLLETGEEKFVDVSDQCGDGLAVMASGRGVAFEDLDNDGRIDVVILNSRGEPTILRNESQTGNHWVEIRLRGMKTNRDGVGARVYVVAGELRQMDEVHSGRGYQSHWGTRLHFGLGKHKRIDRIEVHWPRSGTVDILENVALRPVVDDRRRELAVAAETVVRLPASPNIVGRKVTIMGKRSRRKRAGEQPQDTVPGLSRAHVESQMTSALPPSFHQGHHAGLLTSTRLLLAAAIGVAATACFVWMASSRRNGDSAQPSRQQQAQESSPNPTPRQTVARGVAQRGIRGWAGDGVACFADAGRARRSTRQAGRGACNENCSAATRSTGGREGGDRRP